MVEIEALDLWTLFVNYVFGGFLMTVAGLTLVLFIIMGVLGRVSIYTTSMMCFMFVYAMILGYGYVTFTMLFTLFLLLACIFSGISYLSSKQ